MGAPVALRNDSASSTLAASNLQASSIATDSKGQVFVGGITNTLASPLYVAQSPVATGGLSLHRKLAAASTNSTSVKGSAGQIYNIVVSNMTAAAKFLKLYDKATAPTVGTDTPVVTIPLQANSTSSIEWVNGMPFSVGIGYGLTGALADADTTALAANDVVLNLGYK